MANVKSTSQVPIRGTSSGGGSGVCMMSNTWRDEQRPSFINFISTFLTANSFRLNFVPIAPDFIFNCGGSSVAFIFVTSLDPTFEDSSLLSLIQNRAYLTILRQSSKTEDATCKSLGKPTFILIKDLEMGFEKLVKIAHSRGVCKREDAATKLKAERKQTLQAVGAFQRVITSIAGLDNHDANALNQAIGLIEAIAKASKEHYLENTYLSAEEAQVVTRFFRDPNFYLSPKIS